MKVGILGQQGSWHVTALQTALARQEINAPCFSISHLKAQVAARPWLTVGSEALDSYDLLFVRSIPGGSLEQIIFRVDTLHRLENAGLRLINSPTTIERTVDKYYTSSLLEDAGVPTPRTLVTERFEQALSAFHELGGDVVIKPLFGSEGRGMVRVSDADTAYRVLRALELGRYVYYLQQFVPHGTQDIRAFVVGGQVIAAMRREGQSWKTNVAQGGTAVGFSPDARLCEMAVRAAQAVRADYAGVDILLTEQGDYTVIEVNGIPGWQGLQGVSQVDIAERLVQYALGTNK